MPATAGASELGNPLPANALDVGVDPNWLGLELTENVIMENPEVSIGALQELKALGIQLPLDDSGIACSSLRCLTRFAIDN